MLLNSEDKFVKTDNSQSIKSALSSVIQNYFNLHEGSEPMDGLHASVIKEVEKVLIEHTLKFTNNNQVKASKVLGLSRNTLRKKIQELS